MKFNFDLPKLPENPGHETNNEAKERGCNQPELGKVLLDYLNEKLDGEVKESFELHLNNCEPCRTGIEICKVVLVEGAKHFAKKDKKSGKVN